jgi:hypothetical protein
VVEIDGSGIPDELYRYALSAHFDVLVSQRNKAFLAIEFDGPGHDTRNDNRKAEICEWFGIPLVRVKEGHLDAKVFDDTAIGFLIWQLFCVDAFLVQCGNDPYEPYDPAWFVSVPGKDRRWPFAYDARWRGRLQGPFKKAADRFEPRLRELYSHGLIQFGAVSFTYHRNLEYRSICGQLVDEDHVVCGEAELGLEVYGLRERRLELFSEIASFVEGMAAERMYAQAMLFLDEGGNTAAVQSVFAKARQWETEGFRIKRGFNMVNPTHNPLRNARSIGPCLP